MVKRDRKNVLIETVEKRLEIARINGDTTLLKQLEEEREYYYQKY
jgi:hypothetical protein